ncbi:protein phosphatase 1 regulatory subunit 1B isoform X2 [Sebastes umbrosus]|uniref:protein phosphatase 1 regulatory subunit 1B isoform X2 n=1 Tax=Sebastes umbrosus TaxID=72105 RepID=UPI00189E22D2|nr:protein phosphatase 1 regulatory subunit 1B isoform X2 [Sebastes umbrosus]
MEPSVSTKVEGEPKERKKIQFAVSNEVEGEPKERKKIQFAVSNEVEAEPKERKKIQFAVSTEVEGEPKERRKIQFAMPASVATNLDPRQVEMIRRRRPTPATLFRVADQSSPEDDQSTHQWVVGENGVLKPKRVINPNVYQPPSLRAVQKMAEAHMQHLGVYPPLEDPCEGEEEEDYWQRKEREDTSPTKAAGEREALCQLAGNTTAAHSGSEDNAVVVVVVLRQIHPEDCLKQKHWQWAFIFYVWFGCLYFCYLLTEIENKIDGVIEEFPAQLQSGLMGGGKDILKGTYHEKFPFLVLTLIHLDNWSAYTNPQTVK